MWNLTLGVIREPDDGYQGLRGGGIGEMLLKGANLQLVDK